MSLVAIIVAIIIVGVLLYVINHFVNMDGKIKTILNVVVVLALVLWLLRVFGVWSYLAHVKF